jgi:hypothetical protein
MDLDGRGPLRTIVRLLAPRRWRIVLAAGGGLFARLHRLQRVESCRSATLGG